jgi:hypothetical protein
MPRHSAVKIYLLGLILACGLFAMHTTILFETAILLSKSAKPLLDVTNIHIAGPALIIASFLILFVTHLLEAAAWALLFWRMGEFRTFSESIYFSGTSLTALGYGDIVLKAPWRSLGPIMATNGILMYGCSTAFLFFVIQRIGHTML